MTDDPDVRFANSLMDFLFRRLALIYMPYEERAALAIHTIDERTQPTLPGVEEAAVVTDTGHDIAPDTGHDIAPVTAAASGTGPTTPSVTSARGPEPAAAVDANAPMCMTCGVQMVRSGACHCCPSCGSSSGCS